MQTIAVIGSGISGMASAMLLSKKYSVTLFEKNAVLGGHTRTKTIDYDGVTIPVDTGFIVFNHVNYPELVGMFKYLDVPTEKSSMTFGFTKNNGEFEWGAKDLNAVFGQRLNIIRPRFYRMIADVIAFFKHAPEYMHSDESLTLGDMLDQLKLGKKFREEFIVPMGAAIWSCPSVKMLDFPARTFVQFFKNHGLLSFNGQHQWYTVTGGSEQYISRLMSHYQGEVKLNAKVTRVNALGNHWRVATQQGYEGIYDRVVFASHADETLAMLGDDANEQERSILSAFSYQPNRAYLHRDLSVMPKRRACWGSWVYAQSGNAHSVSVTYWMNSLQNIDGKKPLFVTLNPLKSINPDDIFDEHVFTHPIFTREAIHAQTLMPTIQGVRGAWFCGAYTRYGFHEDGLMSAVAVAKQLGAPIPWH